MPTSRQTFLANLCQNEIVEILELLVEARRDIKNGNPLEPLLDRLESCITLDEFEETDNDFLGGEFADGDEDDDNENDDGSESTGFGRRC